MFRTPFTVNNYQLSFVKCCPTDKIEAMMRIDPYHTIVVFKGLTRGEKDFVKKYLGNMKCDLPLEDVLREGKNFKISRE